MSSKSYTKDDLKKLMQDRIKNRVKEKKINSPFAEYRDDELFCNVCNKKIEDDSLWIKHLISKEHKLIFESFKKNKFSNQNNKEVIDLKKRKLDQLDIIKKKSQKTIHNNLENNSVGNTEKNLELIVDKEEESNLENKVENFEIENNEFNELPKGFFDNPEEDAKARNEILKDPLDDEWKEFKKTIEIENKIVDNYNEIDLKETKSYLEIVEVEEQLEHWKKINELEIKLENKKKNTKKQIVNNVNDITMSDDDSDDLEEFDILSSWRLKK